MRCKTCRQKKESKYAARGWLSHEFWLSDRFRLCDGAAEDMTGNLYCIVDRKTLLSFWSFFAYGALAWELVGKTDRRQRRLAVCPRRNRFIARKY